jgi:hypothetical protein
MALMPNKIG